MLAPKYIDPNTLNNETEDYFYGTRRKKPVKKNMERNEAKPDTANPSRSLAHSEFQ
jgi:hypothetical protein